MFYVNERAWPCSSDRYANEEAVTSSTVRHFENDVIARLPFRKLRHHGNEQYANETGALYVN